eukprot:GHVU01106185.1.p1 GENE.GHVU01106185.1~~GHVU01106185.1.p1  ORF type:complete len:260 (+),score=44.43 GHVU01106185.1:138-917(+)
MGRTPRRTNTSSKKGIPKLVTVDSAKKASVTWNTKKGQGLNKRPKGDGDDEKLILELFGKKKAGSTTTKVKKGVRAKARRMKEAGANAGPLISELDAAIEGETGDGAEVSLFQRVTVDDEFERKVMGASTSEATKNFAKRVSKRKAGESLAGFKRRISEEARQTIAAVDRAHLGAKKKQKRKKHEDKKKDRQEARAERKKADAQDSGKEFPGKESVAFGEVASRPPALELLKIRPGRATKRPGKKSGVCNLSFSESMAG